MTSLQNTSHTFKIEKKVPELLIRWMNTSDKNNVRFIFFPSDPKQFIYIHWVWFPLIFFWKLIEINSSLKLTELKSTDPVYRLVETYSNQRQITDYTK